jgi:hypothetical protein
MAFSLRPRNNAAIPLFIAFSMGAFIYSCSFPTLASSTPDSVSNPEAEAAAPNSTPSFSAPLPSESPLTLPPPNQEQRTIDQGNETVVGGSPYQRLAQTFTVTQSGYLTYVALPINCQPTTWLTIRIESASGGAPTGGVIGTQVISGSDLPSYQRGLYTSFIPIAFEAPPPVSEGELYAFTLETYAGDCDLQWSPPGDTYPGGSAYFELSENPPGWREIIDPVRDLAFQIFISEVNPVE